MLAKRIIACLDVRDGKVVKGVRFKDHRVLGEVLDFASRYTAEGVDELVFYEIAASADQKRVSSEWVAAVARIVDIPFCIAGGIRSVKDAAELLAAGADKISINTAAVENPSLISELNREFGQQCVVVGVDSIWNGSIYEVMTHTGRESTRRDSGKKTLEWLREVQDRGAGEIVLNSMDRDGTRTGYDILHLRQAREILSIPLVASGGASSTEDFVQVFRDAHVSAALAAGAFHGGNLEIQVLKRELIHNEIRVRL